MELDSEESDEALLARLGVSLDAAALTSSLDAATLAAWLAAERRRDALHWRPARRPGSDAAGADADADAQEEDAGALAGDVLEAGDLEFDDVSDGTGEQMLKYSAVVYSV